jgi:chromosome segregation ATPase
MSEADQIGQLQKQIEAKERTILDMRLSLVDSKLQSIEKDVNDHEHRLRKSESRLTEVRTIVTLAFGTGILSIANIVSIWLR